MSLARKTDWCVGSVLEKARKSRLAFISLAFPLLLTAAVAVMEETPGTDGHASETFERWYCSRFFRHESHAFGPWLYTRLSLS